MLDGINDQPEHARRLARRLSSIPAKVNLIPFNPFPDAGLRRSPAWAIDRFRSILLAEGLMTITRKTRGDDIAAACGQLAGRVAPRSARMRRQRAAPRHGHASVVGTSHPSPAITKNLDKSAYWGIILVFVKRIRDRAPDYGTMPIIVVLVLDWLACCP